MKSVVLENYEETTVKSRKDGFKLKGVVIAVIIAAFLIASICVAAQKLNTSSISISAHFSSVTEGKNPDGSPFNINELFCDEVLESASGKLDGKIDVATMKKHLSVTDNTSLGDVANAKQQVIDGNTDYSFYPNSYMLTYSTVSDSIKSEGFIASVKAVFNQFFMPGKDEILKSVAESYSEYYFEKYVAGYVAMELEWESTDSLDYYLKATETKAAAEKISRFILAKYDKTPEFVSEEGIGYGDLYAEIEQIISIDINNYTSFIIQNGVTVDKAALLRRFAFMEEMYNEANVRHMSAYEITKDVIDFYDSNTTKVVFVPALDAERTFYMNRTKVGIDYLIERASAEKISADEALHNAEKYRYLTERFSIAEPVSVEVFDSTDAMYDEIKTKIDALVSKAEVVISEGSQSDKHEKIEFGNVFSNFDLVSMIIFGGKIFVALLLIAFVAIFAIESMVKCHNKKRMAGEE